MQKFNKTEGNKLFPYKHLLFIVLNYVIIWSLPGLGNKRKASVVIF